MERELNSGHSYQKTIERVTNNCISGNKNMCADTIVGNGFAIQSNKAKQYSYNKVHTSDS